jgi:hypothetical protein
MDDICLNRLRFGFYHAEFSRSIFSFLHFDIHPSTVSNATKHTALPNYPFQESKRLKTVCMYLRNKYQLVRLMNLILRRGRIFGAFISRSICLENQSAQHLPMSKFFAQSQPQT